MSNADFDDIFGDDLKMDAIAPPTLTNVTLDDDELFGDSCSEKVGNSIDNCQSRQKANWEHINRHEQDEFLSWLDDGGSAQTEVSAFGDAFTPSFQFVTPPAPVHGFVAPAALDMLDDSDDFDRMLDNSDTQLHLTALSQSTPMASLSIHRNIVQSNGANIVGTDPPISFDDEDDDDLESIVQRANQQANASSSRENSCSSLQIKSQVHTPHKAQVDVTIARQTYLETGELPAGLRLTLWHRAVQPKNEDLASMYAVQTTSRSLPSQALLRKEVEALCSQIFSSAAHGRVLDELGDNMRGTHLLFIDSAETLITHLCTHFENDYSSGLVLTFAPLLLASGCEPLHPEIVEILAATCRRFLPHISKKQSLHGFTSTRRPLLKRLLLYHAPGLASYLNQHYSTWNEAPLEASHYQSKRSGAIADSWLFSFFEGQGLASDLLDFDFLLKVWDASLMLEAFQSTENGPLFTGCFVTLCMIVTAEKTLMRMTGEQLRHCMTTTLLDTVVQGPLTQNKVFVHDIRHLIESTPPCIRARLRRVDVPPRSPVVPEGQSTGPSLGHGNSFGMTTLLSASTQGLKDMSTMMIDMPVKLLTLVPLNPMAALSSSTTPNSLTDSPEAQQLFFLHVQAMDVASISLTLDVKEVIPSVFGGIQGHETGSLRYFIIDCRSQENTTRGQVPTAFVFDPDAVAEPTVLDHALATLAPLKHAGVHICVMGQGYAHIAEELRQFQQNQGVAAASPFSLSEDFLETYARDQTRVQSTIDFLLKHDFPRVSVIDGGYAAAHGYLYRAEKLTVDDLADHDTPNCKLCQHDRSMEAIVSTASLSVGDSDSKTEADKDRGIAATACDAPVGGLGFSDVNLSSSITNPKSPVTNSYYSSFAGAFKTGGKTLLSPTMDGTKWLLKKSAATTAEFANVAANMGNSNLKNRSGSIQGTLSTSTTSSSPAKETKSTMPNLSKFRNSLVAIGSDSLDMLKKVESAMEHAVEQAAVATTTTSAKVRVPFTSSPALLSKETGAGAAPKSPSVSTSTPLAPRAALSSDPAHSKFFHDSTDEMFTIDDDDDDDDNEGQFVHHVEASDRNTSTLATSTSEPFYSSTSIHSVVKGHVKQLHKGMVVSRTQMVSCVSSPFFACYKKKAPSDHGDVAARASINPRRVVVLENHLVVLKAATRNEDDLFTVKSCHSLQHIARMTCLKKNALMVTIYYRWKADNGNVVDKRNSYEVQQRDDFIKAVKTTMDKML